MCLSNARCLRQTLIGSSESAEAARGESPETDVRASCWSAFRASTFEEDKFAVVALVGGVDVAGEADPEDGYGHGVVIQDPVPPHTPEPATLHHKAKNSMFISRQTYLFSPRPCARPALRRGRIPELFFHIRDSGSYKQLETLLVLHNSLPAQRCVCTNMFHQDFFSLFFFLHLTLKTNISPLSMVTVSKSPSQISGGWFSGRVVGRYGG